MESFLSKDVNKDELITILTFRESDELALRRLMQSYFAETGLFDMYVLPPSIILGSDSRISKKLPSFQSLTITDEMILSKYGWLMRTKDEKPISILQNALGLEVQETGLFLNHESSVQPPPLFKGEKEMRVNSLMRCKLHWPYFSIIEHRSL